MIENFRYNYNWLKIFVGFSPELSLSSRVQWRKMFGCWSVNSGLMIRIKKKRCICAIIFDKKICLFTLSCLRNINSVVTSFPFCPVSESNKNLSWFSSPISLCVGNAKRFRTVRNRYRKTDVSSDSDELYISDRNKKKFPSLKFQPGISYVIIVVYSLRHW